MLFHHSRNNIHTRTWSLCIILASLVVSCTRADMEFLIAKNRKKSHCCSCVRLEIYGIHVRRVATCAKKTSASMTKIGIRDVLSTKPIWRSTINPSRMQIWSKKSLTSDAITKCVISTCHLHRPSIRIGIYMAMTQYIGSIYFGLKTSIHE